MRVCISSGGALGRGWSVCCRASSRRAMIDWMCMRQRKIIIGYVNAKASTMATRARPTAGVCGSESRTLALTPPP